MQDLNWNLSRHEYMSDFFLVPALVLAATAAAVALGEPSAKWAASFLLGALAWTLIEYLVHRFVLHVFFRRDHARHHAKPQAWIGISPLVSTGTLALLWALAVGAAGDAGVGSMLFIGFAVGYYAYVWVHFLIHHSSSSLLESLRRHHMFHHRKGARANFGVSLLIWDRIFGTFKPVA